MNVVHEKLTRQRFRELYAGRKPQFELIDGQAEPKALGSKRHALLQLILCRILEQLGFRAWPELSLAIDVAWEPIPNVAGTLGPEETEETYQCRPVAVAIEISRRATASRWSTRSAANMPTGEFPTSCFLTRSTI